jgi:hypothetical protein
MLQFPPRKAEIRQALGGQITQGCALLRNPIQLNGPL